MLTFYDDRSRNHQPPHGACRCAIGILRKIDQDGGQQLIDSSGFLGEVMGSSSKFWIIDGDWGAVHFGKCEIGVRESGGIVVVIYSLLKFLE